MTLTMHIVNRPINVAYGNTMQEAHICMGTGFELEIIFPLLTFNRF